MSIFALFCAAKRRKETKGRKISLGKRAGNFQQASVLTFQEAGVGDMSAGVAGLFISLTDTTKLRTEAEKSIVATIRGKYKAKPTWQGKWWYVPAPTLSYEARDIPHLKIESKTFLYVVSI